MENDNDNEMRARLWRRETKCVKLQKLIKAFH